MSGQVFAAFLEVVRRIPAGKAATYGLVARLAGMPRCARTVGFALAGCRDSSVPCHRVVDRFGGTKAAFDVHAPGTQRALLEAEGVPFRPDGTVDLEQCLWDPFSEG
ncbi:MAG: MGMT family protein [Dysosmobacter sp.]|nr:MGMT family protein [Dysosmobacter sp.]